MAEAPRCPLGFTGTPPVGHPSIPGMGGGAKEAATAGSDASSSHSRSLWAGLSPSGWSPTTLLIVDGFFLVLCVLVALYLPEIKKAMGIGAAPGASVTKAPSPKAGQ